MTNIRKPSMSEDAKGFPLALMTLSGALARTKSSVASDTATDIELNTSTGLLCITVANYPVYVRAQTTASASNFDLYLPVGFYNLTMGDSVTHISYLGDGGTAVVTTVEKKHA